MNLLKNGLVLFILFIYAVACSKQEFAANKNKDAYSTSPITQDSVTLYSNSTLIKPPVDFLILWDNSGSMNYIPEGQKQVLQETIKNVSSRFDYHILVAPLIMVDSTSLAYSTLVVTDPTSISGNATAILKDVSHINDSFTGLPSAPGSFENGLTRVNSLLTNNQGNGIFRKGAYTIVVIMSNGDDTSWIINGDNGPSLRKAFLDQKKAELKSIKENQLYSLMFRVMTLVPHSPDLSSDPSWKNQPDSYKAAYPNLCPGSGNKEANFLYKDVSSYFYALSPYKNAPTSTDSYDICTSSYENLYRGINDAIQDVLIKHKYNYWPVASANTEDSINVSKIRVWKGIFGGTETELSQGSVDGFEWFGCSSTPRPTRYSPSIGEYYAGCMLKLNGAAEVIYPYYLKVVTEKPAEYYGYIQLSSSPMIGTIKVEINGAVIPELATNGWQLKSATNGWQLIGYRASQNIKVVSTSNLSEAYPASYKSGYFLKLYGSAVYSNGATVKVIYDPQANH